MISEKKTKENNAFLNEYKVVLEFQCKIINVTYIEHHFKKQKIFSFSMYNFMKKKKISQSNLFDLFLEATCGECRYMHGRAATRKRG